MLVRVTLGLDPVPIADGHVGTPIKGHIREMFGS
jgi:hypothetical protein